MMFSLRSLFTSGALAILLTSAASLNANAVTFNFATLAQTVGEGNWNSQVGLGGFTPSGSGINVFATANAQSKAYLDGPYRDLPGGLGVCSTSGGCAGSGDDNIGRAGDVAGGALERLTLTFSSQVLLTDLIFGNRDHGLFNGTLAINGNSYTVSGGHLALSLLATVFNFDSLACGVGCSGRLSRDFYLGAATVSAVVGAANISAVPLPAALPLFATGLGALGLLNWRRKRKALATT